MQDYAKKSSVEKKMIASSREKSRSNSDYLKIFFLFFFIIIWLKLLFTLKDTSLNRVSHIPYLI